MRSAPVLVSTHPVLEEIRQADRQGNVEALVAHIERFIATPPAERIDGTDTLCALLSTKYGMARFIEDASWREVITVAELNDPDRFKRNALMILARAERDKDFEKRRRLDQRNEPLDDEDKLLDQDEAFRQKITAVGFCYGDSQSAAYQYLLFPSYLKIIIKHRDLWSKLTIDFLNTVKVTDHCSTIMPVLYELTHYHEGVKFIALLPDLIREDGLNATSTYASVLRHLAQYDEGVDLLHNVDIRKKIESGALNRIDGRDASSAVSLLAKTERGCEVLGFSEIAKKVTEEAFTKKYGHGMPAVFHMAKCMAGLDALAKHRRYRGFIQAYDMNLVCMTGDDAGTSLLFWLLARKKGRDILLNSRELRSLVGTSTLLWKAAGGEFKERCALDFLMMPECLPLLNMMSKEVRSFVQEKRNASMQMMLLSRSRSGLFLHVDEVETQAAEVTQILPVPDMQPVEVPQKSEEPRAKRFGCMIL